MFRFYMQERRITTHMLENQWMQWPYVAYPKDMVDKVLAYIRCLNGTYAAIADSVRWRTMDPYEGMRQERVEARRLYDELKDTLGVDNTELHDLIRYVREVHGTDVPSE